MSSDLRVRILPTTQVFARCPTLIQVEVTNAGADPIQSHAADEGFAVCLASPDILVEGTSVIKKRLSRGELSLLATGQSVRIDFVDVNFTVPGSIQVSAEADCDGGAAGEIVNNNRTDPLRIDLATLSIGTAARLRTAKLKLSLEGSTGARTEISSAPPSNVCPGATLIVETTV